MEVILYRLRRRGEKLPEAEVKANPELGRLVYDSGTAQFIAGGRTQTLIVERVKIDRGILLSGLEEQPGKEPTRQTWYCLPGIFDDLTAPTA